MCTFNRKLGAGAVIAAFATSWVHADPAIDYRIGVQIEHDTNVNLSRDNPDDENLLTTDLAFGVKEQGATLSANVAGSLAYRDYLGGAYGSELRSLLSGVAVWAISPERFDWVAEDYLGRQPVNVLASDVPSNQQQTNVFSTGPTLRARFSDNLRGRLDLRYSNTYADTTDTFNSDRVSGVARLAWLMGPLDTISASLASARVRYDEAASHPFDYDRNDLYFGYEHEANQLKLTTAIGYSALDVRASGNHSGALLLADLHWSPAPTTRLGINAMRQFSDASQDLILDPGGIGNLGVGSGRNGAVIAPQIYIEKRIGLDFAHDWQRVRFDVAPFWRKLDYVDGDALSQRSLGYTASLTWQLRGRLGLIASTGRERRRYTGFARTDDDVRYGLALAWQQARHWIWTLSVNHLARDSSVDDAGYSDNTVALSLTYTR